MSSYLIFLGGVLLGAILANVIRLRDKSFGKLQIDISNPEKTVYRICLDGIPDLSKKKKVVLEIEHNARLSQE